MQQEHSGTCSEYYSTQHAWMRINVIAESSAEYYKWIKQQQSTPKFQKIALHNKVQDYLTRKLVLGAIQ